MNAICISEKLNNSDKIIDAVKKRTINNDGYELYTANPTERQINLVSNPKRVNHTSNIILDQILLSFWTIGEVSDLPPPKNLSISAIELVPNMLLMTAVKEIFADATPGNVWINWNLWRIRRTVIYGSIPIYTPIYSKIRETLTPDFSDSTGTRIFIGTSGTSTATSTEAIYNPGIVNNRQSATPDLRDSNKLDTSIDGKFTNNLVAPPIFTDVVSDKLSNSSSWYLYGHIGMKLVADTVNSMTPQFVDLRFSTIDTLDKGDSIYTPANRVGKATNVAHWSAMDHIFGESTVVGEAVSAKSDYNYKTDFEIWKKNQEFERQKIARS